MSAPVQSAPLPPFCAPGPDGLPGGPPPGTPESEALAVLEVLTGARVARSSGSGRMSLLGRYAREGVPLTRERLLWIALHPFEGAEERWACRIARRAGMTDAELVAAIVQEMGGPAGEPNEMTTLGFWLGTVGFHFDCRGPSLVVTERSAGGPTGGRTRRQRTGPSALAAAARRVLRIPGTPSAAQPSAPDMGCPGEPLQLRLL